MLTPICITANFDISAGQSIPVIFIGYTCDRPEVRQFNVTLTLSRNTSFRTALSDPVHVKNCIAAESIPGFVIRPSMHGTTSQVPGESNR
jgi:hypothetical protein